MTQLRAQFELFLLAVQFLTRIPIPSAIPYSAERAGESVRYYPAVGALVGSIAALIYWFAAEFYPPMIAVLLSTSATVLVTGAFHEDGLADTADGIGGGRTQVQVLEIMRDSRNGTYGMVALTSVLLLKLVALAGMAAATAVVALIVAHVISRLSSVVVIATSQYVRDDGTGKPTAAGTDRDSLTIALVTGAVATLLLLPVASLGAAVGAVAGGTIGHVLARLFFENKAGGYTGDCLGATQQISEIGVYLGILLWL